MERTLNIIMPVKDSMATAEPAIRAITNAGHTLTVYSDYSTDETNIRLRAMSDELGFTFVDLRQQIDHPSPNYRYILITAQQAALKDGGHLVIVESDVTIEHDTIRQMAQQAKKGIGLVAAVTHDTGGHINFPYEYARHLHGDAIATHKRLSFCCTLLSNELLQALPFDTLDPEKNWYDVFISHSSIRLGFTNLLLLTSPVLHTPHSSRPWKQLKYTRPLLYYWRKLTQQKDRI